MVATYALAIGLVFQAIDSTPLPPVRDQHPDTYLNCTYFDFNRNLNYRSRIFPVDGVSRQASIDLSIFSEGFAKAITAQYQTPVDMRHIRCDTIGQWRINAELQHQAALDAGTVKPPSDARHVNWPEGKAG